MSQDLSGKKLGQYELRERLGRGGMADVYKAFQPGMERFVAVKVMLGHLATDEEFVERFKREARAVGTLRHPNIVNVFDFGIEDDMYYMVMEFIQGENLKSYIAKHPRGMAFDDALRITSQIADALSYAHKAGMIHRDVKPANIMFVDDSHEQAILTDFGIAHILSQPGLTASGAMVGTPAYLSPDAAYGKAVDERSDIYGLGIILYEMLTGKVPFEADTPMAIIMKHVNAPLPTRDEYGRDLPHHIEAIILKALMKEADERYQTATDMKQAIDRARGELAREDAGRDTVKVAKESAQAVPVQPDTVRLPPTKPYTQVNVTRPENSRSRVLFQIAGLGVVGIIALLIVVSQSAGNQGAQNSVATLEPTLEEVVTLEPTTAMTAVEAATNVPPSPEVTAAPPTLEPTVEEAATEIAGLPQSANGEINPALLSGLSPLMDEVDTLLLQDRWDELYDAIELAPDSPLGYIALSEAYLNWPLDDAEEALEAAQEALERAPGNPEALWRVAAANYDLGNYAAARLSLQRAQTNGASGFRFAYFAGTSLYYDGFYEQARPHLLTWYQADPGDYSMALAAGTLIQLDRIDAAYNLVKAFPYEMVEAPELWTAAYVAYRAGDFEQARDWALTARALSDEAYPATYVLALESWYGENDLEAALNYFDSLEDVEFYDELISDAYGHDLNIDKGRILAEAGQHREAIAAYEASFELKGEFPMGYILMADSYLELGEPDTALAKLRFALELTDEPLQQRRLLARIRQLAGE